MEINNCCICGKNVKDVINIKNRDIIGMAETYEQIISICPSCGFIFTKNPFSPQKLKERYQNFSKFEYDNNDYVFEENEFYRKSCLRQQQFIYRNIDSNQIKSILEIGASSGYNLSLYPELKRYGVEPSKINVHNAKVKYNVDLFCGMFDDFYNDITNGEHGYDLIFMSMTLEHIINPSELISKLDKLCNGYMFIEVPTFDYKFVNEPYGMFCEEHVNMFTFESLQALMNRYGYMCINAEMNFELSRTLPAGYPGMTTLWKKAKNCKNYIPSYSSEELLNKYILTSKKELNRIGKIIDKINNNERLAIWGTGHHASMLYENTSLKEKNIVKIFDSDKRKIGMSMFGVSIENFDEKYILNKNITAILIASYTAQTSISNILNKYNINIIKLYNA